MENKIPIIFIDDDVTLTAAVDLKFKSRGIKDYIIVNKEEDFIKKFTPETKIAVFDYILGSRTAIDLIKAIKDINRHCWIIVISASATEEDLIDLINLHMVFSYVKKKGDPNAWMDDLCYYIDEACDSINDLYARVRRVQATHVE